MARSIGGKRYCTEQKKYDERDELGHCHIHDCQHNEDESLVNKNDKDDLMVMMMLMVVI